MGLFEKFAGSLGQDRRRKGTKDFAVLDPAIEDVLHIRAARVSQNTAVAQSARTPFGAA